MPCVPLQSTRPQLSCHGPRLAAGEAALTRQQQAVPSSRQAPDSRQQQQDLHPTLQEPSSRQQDAGPSNWSESCRQQAGHKAPESRKQQTGRLVSDSQRKQAEIDSLLEGDRRASGASDQGGNTRKQLQTSQTAANKKKKSNVRHDM